MQRACDDSAKSLPLKHNFPFLLRCSHGSSGRLATDLCVCHWQTRAGQSMSKSGCPAGGRRDSSARIPPHLPPTPSPRTASTEGGGSYEELKGLPLPPPAQGLRHSVVLGHRRVQQNPQEWRRRRGLQTRRGRTPKVRILGQRNEGQF